MNQDQDQNNQEPIDEFSGSKPDVTYIPPKDAPTQVDVTLATEGVFEGGDGENKNPIIGEPDEEKAPEVKTPKPTSKATSKPKEEKPKEEKIDFVKSMRDNDLEIFTKESFTEDASDEEFATQLINDKFLGKQTYVKELDYNTFEYFPEHVSKHIETLKEDIGRTVATLTPEERKIYKEVKGGDELVFNKYMAMANERAGATIALGAVSGLVAVPTAIGAVATTMAMASGAGIAISALYLGAEVANAIDRAQRTSAEELEGMKNTKGNKPFIVPALELAEEYLGMTPLVRQYINDLTERSIHDTNEEIYAKEFSQIALDSTAFRGLGKLLGLGDKGGRAVVSKVSNKIKPDVDLMDKLTELIEVQKAVKAVNKRSKISKEQFASIEANYAHVPPPVPTTANSVIDFDSLAGDAIDKVLKSGGTDLKAIEDFRINNVRGSNYKQNTKLVDELPKDVAEAELKAKKSSETWGKGSEGGGTTIMKFVEKFDELGAMRKNAIDRGDTQVSARLGMLQDDIEHRINIELTQNATKMQEINRSMPIRRHMKTLQNEYAENASLMRHKDTLAKARKKLDKRQMKIEKDLLRMKTALNEASSMELVTMGIANSIYSNMLGGHAIFNAGLGGFFSTATNSVLLTSKGIDPKQFFKMQVNNLNRLQNDFRKFDLPQLRSDAVAGTITSRFKAKGVADVTIKETDSLGRKALKTVNKGVNVVASPIQIGLGTVDFIMDRFNRASRVTEAWYDYAIQQQKLGRTSDEILKELETIVDNPSILSDHPEFYKKVMQATEIGLQTDKMMLKNKHPADHFIARPAWAVDKLFNTTTNSKLVNTALKFVNPFTRTGASMLDSIAENTALGMFRGSAENGVFANITARQMQGTIASMGTAYALHDRMTVIPRGAEKTAGAFGIRSGIQIGGHQFPMSTLGIYGTVIEHFTIMYDAIEAGMLGDTDTSGLETTMGGLLEVLTITNAAENVKQVSQQILNIGTGKSKAEVTKLIEKFAPAGYAVKGVADALHGSLASNPYLAQVFNQVNTKHGNALSRSAFGTPISKGENQRLDRGLLWLLDRKGENSPEIKLNRVLVDAGVYQQGSLAVFRTDEGVVPHGTIMIDGNFTPLQLRMTPPTSAVKVGGGNQFNVSLATKNKALGIMSLRKDDIKNILNEELTNLTYLDPVSNEGKFLRDSAIRNLRSIRANMKNSIQKLAQYGMDKPLPEALLLLMQKDAPSVTKSFDEKSYSIQNLMKFNKQLFDGNLKKQEKFFTQVHRTKDAVLYYNYMKEAGKQFMQNSAEAVSTEIKRIEGLKGR